jgi:ATP-binding cassette, subfamily B, bacterial
MSTFEEQTYNTSSLNIRLWKKLLALLWVHKKHIYTLYFFMIVLALVDLSFPLMNRFAIDEFIIAERSLSSLPLFGIIYFVLVVLQSIVVYGFIRQAGKIETEFAYDVRQKAFTKLQELSFSYYDKTPSGWIMSRMTSDIQRLSDILSWGLMDMVWGLSLMTGISVVMLVINWRMALIILSVMPILAAISVYFQKRILLTYRDVRKVNSKITNDFSENILGAKTSKTMAIEDIHFNNFTKNTQTMKERSIRATLLSAIFMPIVMGFGSLSSAGLLVYGGQQVLLMSLGFGTLMLYTQYVSHFFEPLRNIARLLAELQLAQASAERVLSLLSSEPDVVDTAEVITHYGDILHPKVENYPTMVGHVSFKDVTFYYNPAEPVLKNFNLEVNAGQTIAFVGETGSGKSTIVNLLCRFYEPKDGVIEIDGVDIQKRSLGWLHSNLGYVLQDPHLFIGSVKDNIRYGKLDASDEEVVQAAKIVNAHEFIMRMEDGYDSDVGEGGSRLSTGEKQLLSFARAILADPALFVLDEATASIDTENEKIIQEAISNVLTNRTAFVIAHRLSTIVSADQIVVIDHGKIIEHGTHHQLLENKQHYYNLYTNQFKENA